MREVFSWIFFVGGCAVALLAIAVLMAGCCLQQLTLKPELSAADLKTLTAGNASVDVTLKFPECCPSRQQKDIALQLQQKVEQAYEQVLAGKIQLEQYNAYVRAANDAIEGVILVCKSHEQTLDGAPPRAAGQADPWDKVRHVVELAP